MSQSLLMPGAPGSGRSPLARRRLLLAGAAVFACGASVAAPAVLPASASLPDELAQALKKGMPLLVMVSLDGCPFCKVARESYLVPLREQQGVVVVQLDMRSRQRVKDFKGAMLTHDELIRNWGIKVAPTVLFFGRGGAEIAERMVGGYIPDFYGAYLDERLRVAQVALRS
ncbi:thioredoxin fold domain-containing protein [Polaromonas sp.]|uniref:thioredoxin family protein n=1 Tax=Polaromonas sp. TaxID=1869339 RepID=UPI00248A88F0|nr:thioredoxin fold domain-containing protein [Polaromonas sp.]MDI1272330.1 thioredoxin fold domain-containing protein [Polaromonas sp.]